MTTTGTFMDKKIIAKYRFRLQKLERLDSYLGDISGFFIIITIITSSRDKPNFPKTITRSPVIDLYIPLK